MSWRSLVFFVLERDFTHACGAQAVFWGRGGAQAPKVTPVAPGVLLFGGLNPRLEGTFLAWGAQVVIWGAWRRKASRGAGSE